MADTRDPQGVVEAYMRERQAPQPLLDFKHPSMAMLSEFESWYVTTCRGTAQEARDILYALWEKRLRG
jgi:hypothetical protein